MARATRSKPKFTGGTDIAIKVPASSYAATIDLYERTLGLRVVRRSRGSVAFRFGPCTLHLDRAPRLRRAEVWLEVATPDLVWAREHLSHTGVELCDGVEVLPRGFPGFWVRSPAGTVMLVTQPQPPTRRRNRARKGVVRVRAKSG